jgi:thiol-disulfide isomerase/thioredoxin
MEMHLANKALLPFQFDVKEKEGKLSFLIVNGKERIEVNSIQQKGDTLFAQLPVFESEFVLIVASDSGMHGWWKNYYKGDNYAIPVEAKYPYSSRFIASKKESFAQVASTYEVTFSPGSEEAYPAIGLFEQKQDKVSGTFATETGDYRHLEGNVFGDSLYLSTFDGSHAFLFKAAIKDSLLNGTFWSGNHFKENWIAHVNPKAELRNPDSLTFLKEGYEYIDFTLPDENTNMISLSDSAFSNKVLILQIMGSWCPNCLDETQYLSSLYKQYNSDGLEVIAIAFERTKDSSRAFANLKRLKEKTGAPYPMLLGGATRAEKAEDIFPMLNHIMSYPTAIFIDKDRKVRKIHTGFYGPGTGKYYEEFTRKTEQLIQELLAE